VVWLYRCASLCLNISGCLVRARSPFIVPRLWVCKVLVLESRSLWGFAVPRPARPSTPRRSSGHRRPVDPLTGSTIVMDDFGPVVSDKVYDRSSSLVRNFLDLQPSTSARPVSFDLEIEFNPQFIVTTERRVDQDRTRTVTRTVFQGDFRIDRGRLASARVDRMALDSDSSASGYGAVRELGIGVLRPSSGRSWMESINAAIASSKSLLASFQIGATAPGEVSGDASSVLAFGVGQFFGADWKLNPLAPHLL